MKAKHYGRFVQGKLHADTFKAALRALGARGVPVVLTVEEDKGKRSSPQNRYYHGVVVKLIAQGLKDLGWEPVECTPEAVHETLKYRFLQVDKRVGLDGEVITRVKSTTELNTKEFTDYTDHCVRFAAEYLNVVIPEPGQQMELAA